MNERSRNEDQRFHAFLDAAPTAIVVTDDDGQILMANARTEEMFGHGQAHLLGRPIEILIPERFRQIHMGHRAQFFAAPRTRPMGLGMELTGLHKEGHEFPVEIGLSHVQAGDERRVTAFITDITARKQAQEVLRIKDSAIASSINAIAIADLDGNLTYVNDSFLAMWGYDDTGDVIGQSMVRFWHEAAQAEAVVGALFECGSWVGELVGQRQDATVFDAQLSASLVRDDAENPICLLSSFVDITDRKQAEEQVNWLARFPGENPAPILRVRKDGVLLYANRASTPLLDLWQVGLGDPLPDHLCRVAVEAFLSGHSRVAEVECEGRTLSLIFAPISEARYLNVYGLDVTERRQAEQALRQYTRELEARNEELDAFAHTVAHDLQNPMSLVSGFSEVLAEDLNGFPADELRTHLLTMGRASRKMSNIVAELLLLASVRKVEVETVPLYMAAIVDETCHRLADMIEDAGAEILLPAEWPVALGHSAWIEEVWANYISNAIKYGGRPPRIELGASASSAGEQTVVRFWVRDNGPGLSLDDQARLFTPFTQLGQVHTTGHGLGLSIVRRIVEKLDGRVGVESEGIPGRGSLFYFTLPSAAEDG